MCGRVRNKRWGIGDRAKRSLTIFSRCLGIWMVSHRGKLDGGFCFFFSLLTIEGGKNDIRKRGRRALSPHQPSSSLLISSSHRIDLSPTPPRPTPPVYSTTLPTHLQPLYTFTKDALLTLPHPRYPPHPPPQRRRCRPLHRRRASRPQHHRKALWTSRVVSAEMCQCSWNMEQLPIQLWLSLSGRCRRLL